MLREVGVGERSEKRRVRCLWVGGSDAIDVSVTLGDGDAIVSASHWEMVMQ